MIYAEEIDKRQIYRTIPIIYLTRYLGTLLFYMYFYIIFKFEIELINVQ